MGFTFIKTCNEQFVFFFNSSILCKQSWKQNSFTIVDLYRYTNIKLNNQTNFPQFEQLKKKTNFLLVQNKVGDFSNFCGLLRKCKL